MAYKVIAKDRLSRLLFSHALPTFLVGRYPGRAAAQNLLDNLSG